MRAVWLGALVLLSGLPAPVAAQVKLEWKFTKGDSFFVEAVTTESSTVSGAGKQQAIHTLVARFTVLETAADHFLLEEKIEGVVDRTGGTPVSATAFVLAAELRGAIFKFTLRPHGDISHFEGYDAALQRAAAAIQKKSRGKQVDIVEIVKKVRALIPPESLQGFAAEVFSVLPKKEITQGATWERPIKVSLGPLGSLAGKSRYRYKGDVKEGVRIQVRAPLTFSPPRGNKTGLPFQISAARIKSEAAAGTILFDPRAGRLVRSRLTMHFKGSLTLAFGEKQSTMQMDQHQTVVLRVLDRNPLPLPEKSPSR